MGTKFAWSYDDEDYIGSYEDPQTAFDEAVDAVNAEDRPEVIYVAEIIDTKERLMKGYRLAMANSVIDTLESMLDDFIPSDYQIIEMNLKKFPETAPRDRRGLQHQYPHPHGKDRPRRGAHQAGVESLYAQQVRGDQPRKVEDRQGGLGLDEEREPQGSFFLHCSSRSHVGSKYIVTTRSNSQKRAPFDARHIRPRAAGTGSLLHRHTVSGMSVPDYDEGAGVVRHGAGLSHVIAFRSL